MVWWYGVYVPIPYLTTFTILASDFTDASRTVSDHSGSALRVYIDAWQRGSVSAVVTPQSPHLHITYCHAAAAAHDGGGQWSVSAALTDHWPLLSDYSILQSTAAHSSFAKANIARTESPADDRPDSGLVNVSAPNPSLLKLYTPACRFSILLTLWRHCCI